MADVVKKRVFSIIKFRFCVWRDNMAQTVLIVDDEKNIVNIIAFNLKKEGYDVLRPVTEKKP